MVLEALEDQLRTAFSEQSVDRGKYTIEHVLPQTWRPHWPLVDETPDAVRARNRALHTLGNLTLVTKALNPKLSNGAWPDKRTALGAHSVLRLNHDLLARSVEGWSEEHIASRARDLASRVLRVWPRAADVG